MLLPSCSRGIGHGVILWADDLWGIEAGTRITITEKSMLRDQITFRAEKETYVSPSWRLIQFNSRQEAQQFAETFAILKTLYGSSLKRSLPIRSEKKTNAEIIYRLDEDEIVKIIHKDPEETNLSGLISHWYEVLTQNGTRGWVFGYYLDVYDTLAESDGAEKSQIIDQLFYTMWRPAYFEEFIQNNRIDLDRFNTSLGIGIDPHDQILTLTLPGNKNTYPFTAITESKKPNHFFLENSPIELEFISETRVYAYIKQEAGLQRYEFVKLIDPAGDAENDLAYIQTLRQQEQERRQALLEALVTRSKSFVSATYGILILDADGSFIWNNYASLVPHVIPTSSANTGTVLFSAHLDDPSLADGVIAFVFDGSSERIHFAYTLENSGVRLLFIPKLYVEDNNVKELPRTPVTVFFSFEQ